MLTVIADHRGWAGERPASRGTRDVVMVKPKLICLKRYAAVDGVGEAGGDGDDGNFTVTWYWEHGTR